jgi:hypothetical protein
MSKQKPQPPYLFQVATKEQAALLVELFQKAATPAPQAHVLAALWGQVERCAAHFSPPDKNGP